MAEKEQEISLKVSDGPKTPPKAVNRVTPIETEPKPPQDVSAVNIVDRLINQKTEDVLPWENCVLPSEGIYYDGRIPGGKIQVRPMGITADKILATARLAQSGQSLDYLYNNHVKFPGDFNPLELLVGDRIYILFYLRAITHGNLYEFAVQCTNDTCGVMSTHQFDLNRIEANKKGPVHPKEPVRVMLPHLTQKMGIEMWADCRFLRQYDLQAITKRRQFQDKVAGKAVRSASTGEAMSEERIRLDQSIEENLNLVITSVNGVTDPIKIKKVIERMSQADTQAIRRFLDEDAPRVDVEIIVPCPECNNEMKMDLPITDTFFRPKNNRTV